MITKSYRINASPSVVWLLLTDPKKIAQWSGTLAVMDISIGGNFRLWGGDIWGTNTDIKRGLLLKQDWYGGKWSEPSKVTITLAPDKFGTEVHLIHRGVPEKEEPDFAKGWNEYYFGPLKKLAESGD